MRQQFASLQKTRANQVPLSPLSFLRRAESLHGAHVAMIYGDIRRSWAETCERIRAVAAGLVKLGVELGDTVSVLSPNTPELFELHFAVPLTGGVLNTLNTRLEPETIAYILDHAKTRLVIVDRDLVPLLSRAFDMLGRTLPVVEAVTVIDRASGEPVPRDGLTQGEIAIGGNTVMAGYYKDTEATAAAFADGWFWSGDTAVMHKKADLQIRDRLQDVIISGGENISSVEVEAVLYRHEAVQAAAVVAMPHEKWAKSPAPSSNCATGSAPRRTRSSPFAARIWRASRPPTPSYSNPYPKHPPARSRSSSFAIVPKPWSNPEWP